MDVYTCVRERSTVRQFSPDPIPESLINKLLLAARWAPSSRNRQPWHLIVVKDEVVVKKLGQVASSGQFIAHAPLVIAIARENADSPLLDAGRAIQQMELVAWEEGLGTCFVGPLSTREQNMAKEILRIPSPMELITLLPFGYRTGRQNGKRRKPLSEIAHSEQFGNQYIP